MLMLINNATEVANGCIPWRFQNESQGITMNVGITQLPSAMSYLSEQGDIYPCVVTTNVARIGYFAGIGYLGPQRACF